MQAIEFWSTLAEIEQMYNQEDEENGFSSGHPQSESKHFMDRCVQQLVPLVLELLLQQQEDQDNDDTDWCAYMPNQCLAIGLPRAGALNLQALCAKFWPCAHRLAAPCVRPAQLLL